MHPDPPEELLDLPLEREAEDEPAPPPPETPAAGAPPPRRGLWLVLIAGALVLGALAGYLWPRRAPAVVEPSAPVLDFGEVGPTAGPALTLELDLGNRGERQLRVQELSVTGAAAADYAVAGDGCRGNPVAAGERCTVEVRFAPRPDAPDGPRTAALVIESDAANSPLTVPLTGRLAMPRLVVEPGRIDFGERQVGQAGASAAVEVANRGSAPLVLAAVELAGGEAFAAGADRCSRATLAPGTACRVEVAFAPRRAGEHRARLVIAGEGPGEPAEVELAGTARAPALTAAPLALDFGDQRLGTASRAATVRLSAAGTLPAIHGLAVAAPAAPAGVPGSFDIAGESCTRAPRPDAGCDVRVVFEPQREGPAAAALVVRHGAADELRIPLAGTGVAPRLALPAGALAFGPVRSGKAAPAREVVLANPGSGPLTVAGIGVAGEGRGAFRLGRDGCSGTVVAPSGRCTVEVTFRPPSEGSFEARLEVRSDAVAGGEAERTRLALTGTGVAPRLAVAPQRLLFGSVRRGETEERTLELSSAGSAPLALSRLRLEGTAADDFRLAGDCARQTLAPGERCTVAVRFAPGGLGERSARLAIEHEGEGSPAAVSLAGRGLPPPAPEIAAAPRALTFGTQPVGERSGIVTLTLENPGSARLTFSDPQLTGPQAEDFRLVPATCQGLPFLTPGSFCTVGVRFVPTASGERRARLVLRHNAAGGRLEVELSGRGMSPESP